MGEKIENHISDKKLIFKIYKKIIQLHSKTKKQKNNLIKKCYYKCYQFIHQWTFKLLPDIYMEKQ